MARPAPAGVRRSPAPERTGRPGLRVQPPALLQRNVAHGFLRRPERLQILGQAAGYEAGAVAVAAGNQPEVLGKRMERFGLRLHPEKTRLIAFERPEAGQRGGKGPGTFDFLGFTMYWRRTRRGRWQMWCKTRSKGLRRFNRMVSEWCRRHRHLPVEVQHAALKRRLVGHFNYFGVNGNHRSMARVVHATQRVWRKWLRRRSQRTRLTWERFGRLLERFPLPRPRVVVRIWGA